MKKVLILTSILLFLNSCGIIRPLEASKVPVSGSERVKKNMEEGRGFRITGLGKKGGDFYFPQQIQCGELMDKLSFAPLSVVDYGGGIIITPDWFSEGDSNEEIKMAVGFLSNEIR